MAQAARALALLLVAGLWLAAAVLLWRTSVPHLRPPHVDAAAVFGRDLLRRTARFDRGLRVLWLVGVLAQAAALALVVRRAPRLHLGLGRAGTGLVLTAVAVAAAWAATLPPHAAGLWWLRRHGLSNQAYGAFLVGELETLAGTAAAAWAAVTLSLALAARLGRRWWIPAAALATAAAFCFTLVSGALTTGRAPSALVTEERVLAAREHLSPPRLVVEAPPAGARTANADAVGIGPTRRIALWRTILRPPFAPRELRFLLAHELAHHARDHLWKGIAWFALLSLPVLALADAAAPALRRGEWIPRALLVAFLAQLALLPLENAISRRYEAEADWRALVATRDPEAARALYVDFARTGLEQPEPPGWSYVWRETHPTLLQRVEQALAWRATRASPAGS